jgi:hypothetical protein
MRHELLLVQTKHIKFFKGSQCRDCTLNVFVKLADDCKNKHCDFSITGRITLNKPRPSEDTFVAGGCIHNVIAKHFPELKKFIPLHLCAHEGTPMYPVENGIYHIENSSKKEAMDYLRITDEEYDKLAKCTEHKTYFAYMLFNLGIVDRWKKEADEFVAYLEDKCGDKWENPYTTEEERFRLVLSEDVKNCVERLIARGYYSDENIAKRAEEARQKSYQAKVSAVMEKCEKETEKARTHRDVALCILHAGIMNDNFIYYDFNNTLVFNWRDYGDGVSKEEFDRFVAEADYSLLPEGIKIKFGK